MGSSSSSSKQKEHPAAAETEIELYMALSSSSRWCPTPEQVMILEEIYNKRDIKTPNAFQIQQITNHLSFYGKIEGKNVFYWFQNHKARERQKLRRSKFMQNQKHLQLNLLHHQPYCSYHYSASLTPLALPPQGGRPGAAGHRCWPDINGIGAGVQRSFQSQLCSVGQPLLKTLELFPLKSTNLNSNANPNKDPTSSSRSRSRSRSSY